MENEDIDQVINDILDAELVTEAGTGKVISQGIKDAATMSGKAFKAAQKVASTPFKLMSLIKKLITWVLDVGKNVKIDIRNRIYGPDGKTVDEAKMKASWNRYVENTKVPGFIDFSNKVKVFPVPNSADVVAMGKSVKAYKQALDVLVDTAIKNNLTGPKEIPKFMPKPIFEMVATRKAISNWMQNYTAYKDTLLSVISCVNIFDDVCQSIKTAAASIEDAYTPAKTESVTIKGYSYISEADNQSGNAQPNPGTNQTPPQPQQNATQGSSQQTGSSQTASNAQQPQRTKNIDITLKAMHHATDEIYKTASLLMNVYWTLTNYTSIRDIDAFNDKIAKAESSIKSAGQYNAQSSTPQQSKQQAGYRPPQQAS
jgi:hypothetical protein